MRKLAGTTVIAAVMVFIIAAAPCVVSNPGPSRVSGSPRMLSEWELRRALTNRSYLLGLATERQLSVLDSSHLPLLEELLEDGFYLQRLSACIALRWIGGAKAEALLEEAARDSNFSMSDRELAAKFLEDVRSVRDGILEDDALASAADLDVHEYWTGWDPISDVDSCTASLALGRDGRLLLRFLLDDVRAIHVADEGLDVVHTFDSWEHRWICDELQGERLLDSYSPSSYTIEDALGFDQSGTHNLLVIELPGDGRVVFEVAGDCLRYVRPGGDSRSPGSESVVIRSEILGSYVSVSAAIVRSSGESDPETAGDDVPITYTER